MKTLKVVDITYSVDNSWDENKASEKVDLILTISSLMGYEFLKKTRQLGNSVYLEFWNKHSLHHLIGFLEINKKLSEITIIRTSESGRTIHKCFNEYKTFMSELDLMMKTI